MMSRLTRTSSALLLAASLLLGCLAPPAVRHAHEGGSDLSHCHSDGSASHADDEDDFDHHGHVPAGASDAMLSSECDSHLHFQWFGIPLTLPDGDGSAPGDNPHRTWEWVFVRAARDVNAASQATPEITQWVTAEAALAQPEVVSEGPDKRLAGNRTEGAIFLCDRARHERSGVLLA